MTSPRAEIPVWLQLPVPALALGTGVWLGYRSYDHDSIAEGFLLIAFGPAVLLLALLLAGGSMALVTLAASPGGRIQVALLHLTLLVLTASAYPLTLPFGRWCWEQRVLRPRVAALRGFAPRAAGGAHRPVSIEGYTFRGFEETPEGNVFYTIVLGGPFTSTGIFVPRSDDYRGFGPPQEGRPALAASVTPTSVPGLFWLGTKD